jgi:hypothetical protein
MDSFDLKIENFNKYIKRSLNSSLFGFQTINKIDRDYEELEIELIKETWRETYGRLPSEQEIEDQKIELVKMKYLVESWLDEYLEKTTMENRLKTEKRGFHLEQDGQICQICARPMKADDSWFDRRGLKCLTCKKAITKKVVPASVNKNRESWFTEEQFKSVMEVDRRVVKKLVDSGQLKPRDIMSLDGKTLHFRLFLGKENINVVNEYTAEMLDRHNAQTRKNESAEKVKAKEVNNG